MDINFTLIHGLQFGAEIVTFTEEEQDDLEVPSTILMVSLGIIKITIG